MFETIVVMIGTPFLILIFFHVLQINRKFHDIFNVQLIKPFNCGFCLSFWISLISQMIFAENNFFIAVFLSCPIPFIYTYFEDQIFLS